jgi:hypothetical protein
LFGPVPSESQDENNEISFSVDSRIESSLADREDPLDRAVRLVRQEMEIIESKNQVETNLKAFNVSAANGCIG